LYYASKQQTPLTLILLMLGAVLTAFYMTRQLIMVFFGQPKTEAAAHAQESPRIMTVPLMILAFFSLFAGFLGAALIGIDPLITWLEGAAERHELDMPRALALAGLATLLAVISIAVAYFIYRPKAQKAGVDDPLRKLGFIFKVLNHKYWIDELYGRVLVRPFIWLSNFLANVIDWRFLHNWVHERAIRDTFFKITDFLANPIDKLVIDGAVNGTGRLVARASGGLRKMQTGYVRQYALVMLAGVLLVLAWFALIVLQGY
jgi:NADH-quinone oxidoreductase subunit L